MTTPWQVKPYLEVRRLGEVLRFGNMPPNGVELEEAPDFLDDLVAFLATPRDDDAIAGYLADTAGLGAEDATGLIEQFAEAGLVGPPIAERDGRYARHLLYYDMVGAAPERTQQRLAGATVGIVGAGGIGSNVAMILAAAGVGRLIVTDGDEVELSNLTRQFLYGEDALGRPKVEVAKERLGRLNSQVRVEPVCRAADERLFDEVLAGCDLIVLSADSPDELHDWIDTAAVRHNFGYLAAGYIETFGSAGPLVLPGTTACYECFRKDGELERYLGDGETPGPNLNTGLTAGSYGPLNAIVAALAANEVIRCLAGLPCASAGSRLLLDSQTYRLHTEHFDRDAGCPRCGALPPDERWSGAVEQVRLEDLYEHERTTESVNAVLLDPLLAGLDEHLPIGPGTRVLDVGCGTGEQAEALAARGATVVAMDTSARMLDALAERLPDDLRERVTPVVGRLDTTDVPAAGDGFDLVLCNNVLDHVADLDDALRALRAAVAGGGLVMASVPHPVKDGASWRRVERDGRWHYQDLALEAYFAEGRVTKHREDRHGDTALEAITTFHRTTATYFAAFRRAGFDVVELLEPTPDDAVAATLPEIWEKTSRVPYFQVFLLRPHTVKGGETA